LEPRHHTSDETGVSTMGVSRAVTALHRHGRVRVDIDPANRRRKLLRLTAEGERLFSTMNPMSEQVAAYLCDALLPDEIMAFDRYLVTMIQGLEARDANGRRMFLERTRPSSDEHQAG
jgi:DNA-binding MarR family transcriptional regulator